MRKDEKLAGSTLVETKPKSNDPSARILEIYNTYKNKGGRSESDLMRMVGLYAAKKSREEQEKLQDLRRNEMAKMIYAMIVNVQEGLKKFVEKKAIKSEQSDNSSSEEESESSEELLRSFDSLPNQRCVLSQSLDKLHTDLNNYYALMHAAGGELNKMLILVPDALFMEFVGSTNPRLLTFTVERLRSLHVARLATLLSKPTLTEADMLDIMSEKPLFEIVEQKEDGQSFIFQ